MFSANITDIIDSNMEDTYDYYELLMNDRDQKNKDGNEIISAVSNKFNLNEEGKLFCFNYFISLKGTFLLC